MADHILVQRIADVDMCDPKCPQMRVNIAGKRHVYCRQFGALESRGLDTVRHDLCLTAPSARELTPEQKEAVTNLYLTLKEHIDAFYGCAGAYSIRGEALRQAEKAFPWLSEEFGDPCSENFEGEE